MLRVNLDIGTLRMRFARQLGKIIWKGYGLVESAIENLNVKDR
jgi:hypothetical protein